MFGLGSRGAGAVLLTRKDPSDLCSCWWRCLADASALVLQLVYSLFVDIWILSFISIFQGNRWQTYNSVKIDIYVKNLVFFRIVTVLGENVYSW